MTKNKSVFSIVFAIVLLMIGVFCLSFVLRSINNVTTTPGDDTVQNGDNNTGDDNIVDPGSDDNTGDSGSGSEDSGDNNGSSGDDNTGSSDTNTGSPDTGDGSGSETPDTTYPSEDLIYGADGIHVYVKNASDYFEPPYSSIEIDEGVYKVLPEANYDTYIPLNYYSGKLWSENDFKVAYDSIRFKDGVWEDCYVFVDYFSISMDITVVNGVPNFYVFPFFYDSAHTYLRDFYKELELRFHGSSLYYVGDKTYDVLRVDNIISMSSPTVNVKYEFFLNSQESLTYIAKMYVNDIDVFSEYCNGQESLILDFSEVYYLKNVRVCCDYNGEVYDENGLKIENFIINYGNYLSITKG